MSELTGDGKDRTIDRRGFLKGSALLAAVAGVTLAAPAFARAQEPGKTEKKPDEKDEKDEKDKAEKKPEDKKPGEPAGEQARKEAPAKTGEQARNDPDKLFDKDGREYRVCERCGGNMYKEASTWTCEQCGFSYVE